jgi:hypothetical protein
MVLHVVPAFLLSASLLVHVSAIFRFRRIFATQEIQEGKHRLKLGFSQGTATNRDRGCSFRVFEGNEIGGPAAIGIRTVPMFTGLSCHEYLQLIRALLAEAVMQETSEDGVIAERGR